MFWLWLACAPKRELPPPRIDVQPYREMIDWQSVGDEAADLLSRYIQVDTVNPPGNETDGALFLAGVLEQAGIASEIIESAPGRGNLIARLEGSGEEPPLCLLSHIDVVTSDAQHWSKAPLSGEIEQGMVWGRGALDMKGMGIMELMTVLLLKRNGVPLNRDVILIAVADEEVGGTGMQHLIDHHWKKLGCSHVVNEGGLGLKGIFFDEQNVYPISVGEKGSVWLKLKATGAPGHGSTPRPNEAPQQIIDAIAAIQHRQLNPVIHPAMVELFIEAGHHNGGLMQPLFTNGWLRNSILRPRLMENPLMRASMLNTMHLTGFGDANKPNVVPSESFAVLDCRIQPEVVPEEFIEQVRSIVGPNIEVEVISSNRGSLSPWDDPFYHALARYAIQGEADAVAGPVVSVGYTDSNKLRPLGVHAYGFMPALLSAEDMEGFHGNNEQLSVENLRLGTQKLYSAVVEVSAIQR